MPEIGIVIVTYNSADEIGACLDARRARAPKSSWSTMPPTDGTLSEVTRRGVA